MGPPDICAEDEWKEGGVGFLMPNRRACHISQPNQASDGCRRDQRPSLSPLPLHPLRPSQSLLNPPLPRPPTASRLPDARCCERHRPSDSNFFIFDYQKATSRDLRTSQENLHTPEYHWVCYRPQTIKKAWHYWQNQVKKRHHRFKTLTKINLPLDQGKQY